MLLKQTSGRKHGLGKGIESLLDDYSVDSKLLGLSDTVKQPEARQEQRVVELPISQIVPNPNQPRKTFDQTTLDELAESVKNQGILQPLLVQKISDTTYSIVAGERRYRAAKQAGLEKIPVLIKQFSDSQRLEVALIENIQRENLNAIGMKQIDEAIDRVMMGPAKVSRVYDDKTKKLVAYHESGHAIIGLYLDDAQIVQKVTIIPRGQAGGYNLMTPKEEKMMDTKKDLLASITSYMGGRVAEEMFFDDVTTGASNDIERATNIAKDMVTLYGMSDLGPIKYNSGSTENVFLGRDYNSPNNVSGQVAFEIDEEVRKIINACHDKAKEVIEAHKAELERIASALMEYETLTAEEIQKVVRGEPLEDNNTPSDANKPEPSAAAGVNN